MDRCKAIPLVLAIVLAAFFLCSEGEAFHSGGVAECEGCHTMHNSFEGAAMATSGFAQYTAPAYLLTGTDQSSTCLNCHEDTPGSYHISSPAGAATDAFQMTPGGDFGWLRKTYSWVPRSGAATETSKGERHGHNIKAADYGYETDATISTSPGGSYPAADLSCISCHDPHGRYRINSAYAQVTTGLPIYGSGSYGSLPTSNMAVGVYRLLGGVGYSPKSVGSNAFTYGAIYAVAPSNYNLSETSSEIRVSYGRNGSEWCANCHESMHSFYAGGFVHRAGETLSSEVIDAYNKYRKSGDLTGGPATAFTSLVPFQKDNLNNLSTLAGYLAESPSKAGPASGDRIMCLSCHRAHASGFDSMTRWGLGNEFMMIADNTTGAPAYPGIDSPVNDAKPAISQGRTVAEMQAAYYNRPATYFAPWQRVYGCNKCHAKD